MVCKDILSVELIILVQHHTASYLTKSFAKLLVCKIVNDDMLTTMLNFQLSLALAMPNACVNHLIMLKLYN